MKSEDKVVECQSKVWNRNYVDTIGIVGELSDGMNLMVSMEEGQLDVTDEIKDMTVNLRFSEEQWEALNSQFHDMTGIGAVIEIEVRGNVRWSTLEIRGEEQESYLMYVENIVEVEELEVAEIAGSMTTKEDFLNRLRAAKAKKAAKSESVRAQSRSARAGMTKEAGEKPAMSFG